MAPQNPLETLRAQKPLVHCITNYVAMNIAANVVLAAGASPAMVHAEEEIADFTPICGALSINIGTLSPPWLTSMTRAAQLSAEKEIPWVFDPVAHFISAFRRQATQDLLAFRPAIIRGNASEILSLAGESGQGKGADSGDSVDAAHDAARRLAAHTGAVVAVTGPVDFVTDGDRQAEFAGGSPLMPQVTALGCAQGALMAAYAANTAAFDAASAALVHFNLAGAAAARAAEGPGSFQSHFLDALAATRPDAVAEALA